MPEREDRNTWAKHVNGDCDLDCQYCEDEGRDYMDDYDDDDWGDDDDD